MYRENAVGKDKKVFPIYTVHDSAEAEFLDEI
jgi:hypothetical protein